MGRGRRLPRPPRLRRQEARAAAVAHREGCSRPPQLLVALVLQAQGLAAVGVVHVSLGAGCAGAGAGNGCSAGTSAAGRGAAAARQAGRRALLPARLPGARGCGAC